MSYILEPEVAGGWGEGTEADTSCHPPKVSKLVYEFEGWSGNDLLTTFPCFIVSIRLAALIEKADLSGYTLAPVEIMKSDVFCELFPNRELPEFKWLKIHGKAGSDDFAINDKLRLVVTEAAWNVLSCTNLDQCEVTKL